MAVTRSTKATDSPRRPARPRVPVPTEAAEQRAVAQYLDFKRHLWCAVPNGGSRGSVIEAANLKRLGVKAGVPDILIFTPPPRSSAHFGAALEMKRRKGGRVQPDQARWMDRLQECRWLAHVAHGAEDAIAWLKQLGY